MRTRSPIEEKVRRIAGGRSTVRLTWVVAGVCFLALVGAVIFKEVRAAGARGTEDDVRAYALSRYGVELGRCDRVSPGPNGGGLRMYRCRLLHPSPIIEADLAATSGPPAHPAWPRAVCFVVGKTYGRTSVDLFGYGYPTTRGDPAEPCGEPSGPG